MNPDIRLYRKRFCKSAKRRGFAVLRAPSYNALAYIVAKRDSNGGGEGGAVTTVGVAVAGLITLTVPAVGLVTIMVAAPTLVNGG